MPDFGNLSLEANLILFAVVAAVIVAGGLKMTRLADILADRTGFGEALVGGVLLGASTSLAGTVASVAAAAQGHPVYAVSNAIGGIAAQTAFLAIADVVYRKANLEHAAASLTNMTQATMLMILLTIPLLAWAAPDVTILGVHPATPILLIVYVAGVRLASAIRLAPMWKPQVTSDTRTDLPAAESAGQPSVAKLVGQFVALSAVVGVAGWLIAETGLQISQKAGISESVVGALLTAVVTSLPELVTVIAAIRRGALQLAVGGIIGGNSFDVLFLALSDIAYRKGSIYHAIGTRAMFWIVLALLMTGVLLLGFIRRQRKGPANIGFESTIILALYVGAVAIQTSLG
jgi:cation:H+ antiporter